MNFRIRVECNLRFLAHQRPEMYEVSLDLEVFIPDRCFSSKEVRLGKNPRERERWVINKEILNRLVALDMTTWLMSFPSSRRCKLWKKPISKMSSNLPSMSPILSVHSNSMIFSRIRYTQNCDKLLAKYTAAYRQIESDFPKIEEFARKYKVNPRRLIDRQKSHRSLL